MPWRGALGHPELSFHPAGLCTSISTLAAPHRDLEAPLTFLLDFIRQIGMVPRITAAEYLPESVKNRHEDLP